MDKEVLLSKLTTIQTRINSLKETVKTPVSDEVFLVIEIMLAVLIPQIQDADPIELLDISEASFNQGYLEVEELIDALEEEWGKKELPEC